MHRTRTCGERKTTCKQLTQPNLNKSSAVAEMGNRGHNRHGPKRGELLCPLRGELGPRLMQCGLGWRLRPYQVASSSIQLFATIDMNRKMGGCATFRGGSCDPISDNVAWANVYLCTKCHFHPSSCLATIDLGQKLGDLPLLGGGKLCPHLAQCGLNQGPPPRQVPPRSAQQQIGWGVCALFSGGSCVPIKHSRLGRGLPPYQVASYSIQPFGHNGHWPKIGGRVPLGEGELGPHLTQCRVRRGLPPYQVASWSMQQFGHNRRGPIIGGYAPFWGGAGSPSNTKLRGLRPTSIPSGISMHPAVWPQ